MLGLDLLGFFLVRLSHFFLQHESSEAMTRACTCVCTCPCCLCLCLLACCAAGRVGMGALGPHPLRASAMPLSRPGLPPNVSVSISVRSILSFLDKAQAMPRKAAQGCHGRLTKRLFKMCRYKVERQFAYLHGRPHAVPSKAVVSNAATS